MSCYHPLIGLPSGLTDAGKTRYVIKGQEYLKNHSYEEVKLQDGILLPCGKCIGCRLDYSRTWADRMMLELETEKKAVFLTLTYDNDHCPWSQFDENGIPMYGTLNKRDCQLFMKRLRKRYQDVKIRFYLAGEYGSKTLRPHYHAIVYGFGLYDFKDLRCIGRNELGQAYYVSEDLAKIWNNGFVLVANVSWKTCAYVARYITKKLTGQKAVEYAERNVIPEFSLMSRKPGIGSRYLEENPDCLDFENINLSTPEGGLKIRIPKYYIRKLELQDKERADIIRNQRKKCAEDSLLLQLQNTDLSYVEYLEAKEINKMAKIKKLNRK